MLSFLVTSRARRRLLVLLWDEGKRGSAVDLAEAAGVGFASAYRELKAMVRHGLAVTTREAGRDVYRANQDHPEHDLLRRLARSSPAAPPPDDRSARQLRRALRDLGAPLPVEGGARATSESVEMTLVAGVKLARRDPTVARVLPVCFWKQRDRLDPDRLADAVRVQGERQATGFVLALTAKLSGDRRFARWAPAFRDRRVTAVSDFFELPSSKAERGLAGRRTPALARAWGFRLNMDLATFASTFERFAPRSAPRQTRSKRISRTAGSRR